MIIRLEERPPESFSGDNQNELDRLTPEEVESRKYTIWSQERVISFSTSITKTAIVAEGDSWFDYAPGIDVLDHLTEMGHAIAKVAKAGDTLENMVYGTEFTRSFAREPCPLDYTIMLMVKNRSKLLLFSGGGNDVAGNELEAFLNHRDMDPLADPLRDTQVENVLRVAVRKAYVHLIERVKSGVGEDVQVVTHGYGYPIPDGRAVINLPWGFHFVGPWLRPALTKKNHVGLDLGRAIMKRLVDAFNGTLEAIAGDKAYQDNFHYIDCRQFIAYDWWVNELHLRNSGYFSVAQEFDRILKQLYGK